jgi:hypothetical protein
MSIEQTIHPATQPVSRLEPSRGTIVAASYREDGWEIEVENPAGLRLAYWVGGCNSAPAVGSTISFYHGQADNRVCRIEIDGERLFDTCDT